MPDISNPAEPTPMTPEDKAATIEALSQSATALAGLIASLTDKKLLPLIAAFGAVLKYAPTLYLDFVQLFAGGEPSQAQKDDFHSKLAALQKPEDAYRDP